MLRSLPYKKIQIENFSEDNASEGTNITDFPSLYDVRNQLQNVIDVMGTTTPHLIYSSVSGDADNEESVISSTSIISSVLQVISKRYVIYLRKLIIQYYLFKRCNNK